MSKTIDNSDDLIDVRDVIARFEELEAEKEQVREDHGAADVGWDNRDEFNDLRALLADLNGMGGDEQWRGDWYPITMIRDSYFKDYAMDLADDIGAIPDNAAWPCTCIDWDKAARELRMDYSSVEFNGITYWVR